MYSPKLFKKICNEKETDTMPDRYGTYHLSSRRGTTRLSRLIDHGFIADRACIFGPNFVENDDSFSGQEFAIISRTYLSKNEIEELKVKCQSELDIEIMPDVFLGTSPGIVVATMIKGIGSYAEEILQLYTGLEGHILGNCIGAALIDEGYAVVLDCTSNYAYHTSLRIVKVEAGDDLYERYR